MASFASSTTTGGERKHAWTKKVGENNGQLRLVHHHGWRMQARLDQHLQISSLATTTKSSKLATLYWKSEIQNLK